MTALARRLEHFRSFLVELGPLRPVALATAVLPTTGMIVLLARLPQLAANLPPSWSNAGLVLVAITILIGAVLLPPAVAAVAAGYCLGLPLGLPVAVVGIGLGGVVSQRLVWPLLGARLYEFMRARPRVQQVLRLCAGNASQQVRGVLRLRAAAAFPFPVTSLLLSAAAVPARAVWLGSMAGMLPATWLASAFGCAWRTWRERGEWPSGLLLANLVLALLLAAAWLVAGRRAWWRSTSAT